MSRSPRPGRACLALALVAAAWAAVIVLSGGFTFAPAGLRLSSRDPLRPLLVSAVLLLAARIALGAPEFWRLVLRAVGTSRAAVAARIAGLAALAVLVVAIAWNTRAAGGSDILLVALTGYGQPEDRRRAAAAGFDAHITKPINFTRLGEILSTATRDSPATAAVAASR